MFDGLIIEECGVGGLRGQLVMGDTEEQGPENIFQLRERMLRVQLSFVTGGAPKLRCGGQFVPDMEKMEPTANHS